MLDLEVARTQLECLHRQVMRRAIARGPVGELARLVLGQGDQVIDILDPESIGGQQHQGSPHRESDRREAGQRVISQLLVNMRIERKRGVVTPQQGVSIGARLGHLGRSDRSACTWLVIDNDGLPQQLADFLCELARQDIGAASCGIGHHKANRPARIVVLSPSRADRQHGQHRCAQQGCGLALQQIHGCLLLWL
ncbi:hypothetical protein D9M68_812920 [compost metagenome]